MIKDNNKGYTLIEMIIVIAIIAILSAAATVSITLIHSAKAREASINFESEIAEISTKSRNLKCTIKQADGTLLQKDDYMFCLKLHKEDETFYVAKGFYDTSTDTYIFDSTTDQNNGKGVSLSKYINIKYTQTGSNTVNDFSGDDSKVYIKFSKNGTVIEGDGLYEFYKKNGSNIASVTLRKNGSHDNK